MKVAQRNCLEVENGAMGAITDVAGIKVGHQQRSDAGWMTGVTVVDRKSVV